MNIYPSSQSNTTNETNNDIYHVSALSVIRSKENSLASSERKVASWVLNNSDRLMAMSMAQVANECNVSDTTVLRFCRSIGYIGFTDMKLSIARVVGNKNEEILGAITQEDDFQTIIQKVFSSNIQALHDTVEVINYDSMALAIDLICSANRILIFGVGTSSPIVKIAENYFMRLGLNCKSETDSYLQLMEASLLSKGDLALGISHSGSSMDPVSTMKIAHQRGAGTICITGNEQAPITEFSDVVLLSVSKEARAETIESRLAQISIVDALYMTLSIKFLDMAAKNEKKIWDAIMAKMV